MGIIILYAIAKKPFNSLKYTIRCNKLQLELDKNLTHFPLILTYYPRILTYLDFVVVSDRIESSILG